MILLLSNSSSPAGYLEHARGWIAETLAGARRVAFAPFAGVTFDHDDYTERVAGAMTPLGVEVVGMHRDAEALANADAVFVGGGNTFVLLDELYRRGLLGPIRKRVLAGAPYVGWSAGANVAGPTIRTTNDMPVVEPPSFEALGLVSFQINPHYTDLTIPGHGGESRAERLQEFVVMNPGVTVAGLPEGTALRVAPGLVERLGPNPVRLFGAPGGPRELAETDMTAWLGGPAPA